MLPRVDINSRPGVTIEAPSASAVITATKQEVASKLCQLVIGKQIQGEILSRRNDGTFFVKIAGATARMALPQESKVGDAIALTLLAVSPRPTFLLGGHGDRTSVATFAQQDLIKNFLPDSKADKAATLLSKTNTDNSGSYILDIATDTESTIANSKTLVQLDQQASASATTSLSNAGKLINSILKEAELQGPNATLVSKTMILQNSEELTNPEKLASRLQQFVSGSGLFYESHVASWAEGKFIKSNLMQEPQAQMNNAASVNFANATHSDDTQARLSQLIHMQLDSFEEQRLSMQGRLLPNLPFEWEITRDQNHAGTSQNEADKGGQWQSVVRFELPLLGVVAATINMHAGQLQLSLRSDTVNTVHTLQEHAPELIEALNNAGSTVQAISVKHDEQV
ncbi:flagellar hook-length control protein FliK [Undibacterium sp.]|uniref:flagellar hook-length control protein FliK n=1 Tax=Undibacterium sp. TaxID=1914977 RepID=UPI0025E75C9D|nr:flagellar hook-length control protein FliK [Undibacterium sp.]